MKKRLISVLVAVLLIGLIATPAMALDEQTATATVGVNQVISITIADANSDGINFVGGTPPITEQGDTNQADGTPAVTITIATETNVEVDVGIMGAITLGDLALTNWKYSKLFDKVGIAGLTGAYVEVYGNEGPPGGSPIDLAFYHWIDIPDGTTSGTHTVDVSYKAQDTAIGF